MEPSFTMLERNLLVIMYFVLAFGTALLQAMPSLPAETIEAVDGIINDQNLPVLAKISKLFKCIADSGMGYYQQIVPKDTLTHPANRGGSLLNSNDVWSKGLRMLGIGVQPSMLQSGAVCFEPLGCLALALAGFSWSTEWMSAMTAYPDGIRRWELPFFWCPLGCLALELAGSSWSTEWMSSMTAHPNGIRRWEWPIFWCPLGPSALAQNERLSMTTHPNGLRRWEWSVFCLLGVLALENGDIWKAPSCQQCLVEFHEVTFKSGMKLLCFIAMLLSDCIVILCKYVLQRKIRGPSHKSRRRGMVNTLNVIELNDSRLEVVFIQVQR